MENLIYKFINYIMNENLLIVYISFFMTSFLQILFPPIPGDVIMVFEGYLTTVSDNFRFIPVLLVNIAGTVTGSLCVYYLGYKYGENVFELGLIKKYIHKKYIRKATHLFEKYGSFAVFMSKFIPGVNAVILLFSGIFKVKPSLNYSSILISSIIHHIVCLKLGRLVGYNLDRIKYLIEVYNILIIIIILVSAAIVYFYYRSKKKKNYKS